MDSPIEVRRYVRADGWATRHWAVYDGGELLAVVVYKKGAQAIADRIRDLTLALGPAANVAGGDRSGCRDRDPTFRPP